MEYPSYSRRWLKMSEFADIMGISYSTVKRLKLANEIPFRQEGKIVRIPIEATEFEWLENWRRPA